MDLLKSTALFSAGRCNYTTSCADGRNISLKYLITFASLGHFIIRIKHKTFCFVRHKAV